MRVQLPVVGPGYPCVDLSCLNNCRRAFDDPNTSTGGTQQCIMKYVTRRPPPILILENVAKITARRQADSGKPSPVVQQHELLRKYGYAGTWFKLNACHYALAQSRPRVYMVYYHGGAGDIQTLKEMLWKFRANPKPLLHYFLPDADVEHGTGKPRTRPGGERRTAGRIFTF